MNPLTKALERKRSLLSTLGFLAVIFLMFYVTCSPRIIGASAGERILPIYSVERDNKAVALTFDAAIPDKLKKNTLSIDACADFGPAALIIKCLDTMDNMDYFSLASEKDQDYLLKKYDYLKTTCEAHIPLEPAYIAYKTKLDSLLHGLQT